MEAKRCLVLMLIILGSLTVQGAMPRNRRKNPLAAFARQQLPPRECFFDFIYLNRIRDELILLDMEITIKYDYRFVFAIVTSMTNKRTTFSCLQSAWTSLADTAPLSYPAAKAITSAPWLV